MALVNNEPRGYVRRRDPPAGARGSSRRCSEQGCSAPGAPGQPGPGCPAPGWRAASGSPGLDWPHWPQCPAAGLRCREAPELRGPGWQAELSKVQGPAVQGSRSRRARFEVPPCKVRGPAVQDSRFEVPLSEVQGAWSQAGTPRSRCPRFSEESEPPSDLPPRSRLAALGHGPSRRQAVGGEQRARGGGVAPRRGGSRRREPGAGGGAGAGAGAGAGGGVTAWRSFLCS